MVGKVGFMMGGSRWCQPYGATHLWLSGWLLMCRLCGLCARLGWAAMMMCNHMLCARHGLVGAGLVHEQMLVG